MPTKVDPSQARRASASKRRKKKKLQAVLNGILAAAIIVVAVYIFLEIEEAQNRTNVQPTFPAAEVTAMPEPSATPALQPTSTPSPTEAPVTAEPTAEPELALTPEPTHTLEPTSTPSPTTAPTPVNLKYPYLIELDKSKQVVTVYTIGETGYYDLIVKQFICSSGKSDKIEDGMYKMGEKYRWKQMENESYAQYACRISGPYLFHSCCYYTNKTNKLKWAYYDNLGKNVSSGCVRLTAGAAYWIYTNCPTGTPIHVMTSGVRDEELLKQLQPPPRKSNWDPTDPDPKNPYYVTPSPDTTPDPTPALGVTPAPTPAWTVHPKLKAWGKY